jgi:hypothetical protein
VLTEILTLGMLSQTLTQLLYVLLMELLFLMTSKSFARTI